MAWNDGITEELSSFLDGVKRAGAKARKIGEQVIDEEVKTFSLAVEPKIPENTGGLKRSFTVQRDTSRGFGWYGYSVTFVGNAPNGEPYEKIANIENYGTPYRAGSFFITKAIKGLRGMDARIEARIEAEMEKSIR